MREIVLTRCNLQRQCLPLNRTSRDRIFECLRSHVKWPRWSLRWRNIPRTCRGLVVNAERTLASLASTSVCVCDGKDPTFLHRCAARKLLCGRDTAATYIITISREREARNAHARSHPLGAFYIVLFRKIIGALSCFFFSIIPWQSFLLACTQVFKTPAR